MKLWEIALWLLTPTLALLGAWIAHRVKVGKIEESNGRLGRDMEQLTKTVNENVVSITNLQNKKDKLEEDSAEFKKLLSSLDTTLGELNMTLARIEERTNNVEKKLDGHNK